MTFFLRLSSIVSVVLVCLYQRVDGATSYDQRGKEVIAIVQGKKASWVPKINQRFTGQDEFVLKKVTGVKPDFATHKAKRNETNAEKPKGKQKGKNTGKGKKHGNHTTGTGQGKGKGEGGPPGKGGSIGSRQKRSLPTNYDWRDHTTCESFDQVRYQNCGDCWAVASAAAISDRYCLYTWRNRYFSSLQISSCVYGASGGCEGGYPQDAASYYYYTGVASGNDPTVAEQPVGCLPYPNQNGDWIQCPTRCANGASLDTLRAGDWRDFHNEQDIMDEIYIYGSVVAVFEVFQDFGYMSTGVYQHVWGPSQGWHAVRLIGWGVDENGIPYWQAVNQWGTQWGDEGFFKMLRGSNHCGIESYAVGVYPIEAWGQ